MAADSSHTAPARSAELLQAIRDTASLINANNDYPALFSEIVGTVCDKLGWSRSAILVLDRDSGRSRVVAFRDRDFPHEAGSASWDLISSPTLTVAETGVPLILRDARKDSRFPAYQKFAIQHGLQTIVLLPLSATDIESRQMVFSVGLRKTISVEPHDLDFLLTISHLISVAVDKQKRFHAEQAVNNGLRALFRSNSAMMQRIASGCTFNELVDMLDRELQLPFAVSDELSASLIWSRLPSVVASLPAGQHEEARGQLTSALQNVIRQRDLHDRVVRLSIQMEAATAEVPAIIVPLMVGDQILGGLALFPEGHHSSDLQLLVAQGAQQVVSAHLMRTYAPWTQKSTAVSAFFAMLFDGDWQVFSRVEEMAKRVGVDLSFPAQFIAADLQPVITESMTLCRSIETAAKQILVNSEVFYENQILYVYVPLPQRGSRATLSRLIKEVGSQIEWRTSVKVGITSTEACESQFDFKSVRSYCSQVFRLARLFDREGYLSMEDFGSFAVLVSALGDTALTNFLNKTLQPILKHDEEKNGALLQCGEAFLENACRYQATADSLSIHVSTLRYRLKRLSELFSLDLENSEEDRFTLSLALRIRQLRN